MKFDRNSFREFTDTEATEWGKEHYSDWMPELQNQDYKPQTPAEQFFRYYTQGIHTTFNRILRDTSIETYNYEDSSVSKEMFLDGIAEINKQPIAEDIMVYRYVAKDILRDMKKWSNVKLIRRNSIIFDKGFLSTTLSLDSVKGRHYATLRGHSLMCIYVPKGTPCAYMDLVSDMHENELLFAPNTKLKVIGNYHWFVNLIECVVVNE